MNVTAHQEKKKNEETKKGRRKEKEKTSNLLQSFRGQHSEKVKGSARVTGSLEKANSHFNLTQTGSGTTPPR